ncbi:MAG: hypothetical protein J5911_05160 [Clostridia bacterium]|nr:hypothetical protein [Clostridia bacterium]
MFRKIREKFSVLLSRSPGKLVVFTILLINILFILLSALIITSLSLSGTKDMGFIEALFYTITMILDAGCIQFVVEDIGIAGVALVIACLLIIVIGMILFTGAVIGYITNYISDFIQHANGGSHKLFMNDHTVIINWNSRASEIVNDTLFKSGKQKLVVLVPSGKDEILKEINERIVGTIHSENAKLKAKTAKMPYFKRKAVYRKEKLKNNIVLVVREGDTFSYKQLSDVSLERAKAVIILGNDMNNNVCKYDYLNKLEDNKKGNPLTIKTLMQVAEITSAQNSSDHQKIIVEVDDDWTLNTVKMIISAKQVAGKCNIVPVSVNKVLGRMLSQFSLMPELNSAYVELLSNKGVTFYAEEVADCNESKYIRDMISGRKRAIPLTVMDNNGIKYGYFAAENENDSKNPIGVKKHNRNCNVKLNYDYWLEQKNVIILGHNSKIPYIMEGFNSFRQEWNFRDGREIMNVIVIDDKQHLENMNYYKQYPYVKRVVEAEIYDKDLICSTIEEFVDSNEEDTSILVLSDDSVLNDEVDATAIANLIYIRDIVRNRKAQNPNFDEGRIDIVVEIINPKHYDIIKNYNVNNVVISNMFISKMIGQLGEKDVMFDFYNEILTYDDNDHDFESKELYSKKVSRFFSEVPKRMTVEELIAATYFASVDKDVPAEKHTNTIVLGYVKPSGELTLFGGDMLKNEIELKADDKIIVFADH